MRVANGAAMGTPGRESLERRGPLSDPLPGIPAEARRVFESLLPLDLEPASALEAQVDQHLAELEDASDEFVDLATARELARVSRRLLTLYPTAPEHRQRLIQAAVLYFVQDRDATPDSSSRLGLEDDARVLHAVSREVDVD